MSSALQSKPNAFTRSARDRIAAYVAKHGGARKTKIDALTPDASTREYFRIPWNRGTAVAAVYPEPFDPEFHPYLDVTRLFLECNLPVPEVYEADGPSGIIVQEDLGDSQLWRVFETVSEDEREDYLDRAIALIAEIQAATDTAFKRKSIASRLAFDEPKLSWELGFFMEHYFGSLRGEELKHAEAAELREVRRRCVIGVDRPAQTGRHIGQQRHPLFELLDPWRCWRSVDSVRQNRCAGKRSRTGGRRPRNDRDAVLRLNGAE